MARDFIKIDTSNPNTAPQAQSLKTAIAVTRQAYMQLTAIKAIMTHMNDGTIFTDIETFFGLPSGKGQAVFDYVNGSVGAMEGTFQNSNTKTITEQVG